MKKDLFLATLFSLLFLTLSQDAPAFAAEKEPDFKTAQLTLAVPGGEREAPVLCYFPAADSDAPLPAIIFSHGLGGSCKGYAYLGEYWAGRGYLVFVLQHIGSDDRIWRGKSREEALEAMRKAVTVKNMSNRLEDVHALIDNFVAWNSDPQNPLYGKIDQNRIGMGGHSFGALTTQVLAGQLVPLWGDKYADKRIKAALVLSPSYPQREILMPSPFSKVEIPWLLMTGTEDVSIVIDRKAEERLKVFEALPPGHKYQLVIFGGNHMLFTGINRPAKSAMVQQLSTLFWDAWLKDDPKAREALESGKVRELFAPKDDWRIK